MSRWFEEFCGIFRWQSLNGSSMEARAAAHVKGDVCNRIDLANGARYAMLHHPTHIICNVYKVLHLSNCKH